MQWHTELIVPESSFTLDVNSSSLMLGSCFTEHISKRMQQFRLPVTVNPQGIIFNPVALAGALSRGMQRLMPDPSELFEHLGIWRHFDFHSSLCHPDKETCLHTLQAAVQTEHAAWKEATHVLVTFGTAWGYRHNETKALVANNHKLPLHNFTQVLHTVSEVVDAWHALLQLPEAQEKKWLFTVSPVRHLRTGVVENMRSKAILLEAIHQLAQKHTQVTYFPAFEIMMDDLRDYRFYEADMIHPNEIAIEYIWDKFLAACTAENLRNWVRDFQPLLTAQGHKPFHPDTDEHKLFLERNRKLAERLQQQYPKFDLSADMQSFS